MIVLNAQKKYINAKIQSKMYEKYIKTVWDFFSEKSAEKKRAAVAHLALCVERRRRATAIARESFFLHRETWAYFSVKKSTKRLIFLCAKKIKQCAKHVAWLRRERV